MGYCGCAGAYRCAGGEEPAAGPAWHNGRFRPPGGLGPFSGFHRKLIDQVVVVFCHVGDVIGQVKAQQEGLQQNWLTGVGDVRNEEVRGAGWGGRGRASPAARG